MSNTPASKFGKDHWSMLAYIETLCVEGKDGIGKLDKSRVRCNENTHPMHNVNLGGSGAAWKPNFSTRLFGFFDFQDRADTNKAVASGFQLLDHDDWDCMNDIEAAGYIEILSEANGLVRMTKEGCRVNGLLREHKTKGGMYAGFVLDNALEAA